MSAPASPRMRALVVLAAIVAVHVALYAPVRRFDFVWADVEEIRDSAVYDLPLWRELRTTEHARYDPSLMQLHGIALTHEGYRPLLILSHNLDIALFGRVPGPMHVVNLILDVLCILAAFWLALRVLGAAAPALAVTALFAWHPLHVEPIAFLTARADPLAALFAIVAAALVVEGAALGAGLAMLLSLFAKEADLLVPFGVLALALALGRVRAWWRGLVAIAAAVPIYALVRTLAVALGPAATHEERLHKAFVALPAIVLEYARAFVLPFDLSISRPLYLAPAVGWAAFALAVVVAVVAWRRAPASWRQPLALAGAGVAWAGACIAPAAVAVFSEATVADRFAYAAVFGFALAVVAVAARVAAISRAVRIAVVAAGALFLALCLFVSARELPHWASSGLLFAHDVDANPDNAMAHDRFGRWLAGERDWGGAADHFERAASLPGAGDRVLNNLGVAYLNLGRLDDAERTLRLAIARSGDTSYHAWYNLGTTERALGRLPAACDDFRRAVALDAGYKKARADLARYCPQ